MIKSACEGSKVARGFLGKRWKVIAALCLESLLEAYASTSDLSTALSLCWQARSGRPLPWQRSSREFAVLAAVSRDFTLPAHRWVVRLTDPFFAQKIAISPAIRHQQDYSPDVQKAPRHVLQ
ncbi:hypothetical protein [Pseudoxanthomonas sp. UTMC 1351]|uniref:hypothetical protein n=1 Tax=Pseudoxanthomonas sp. UTMC 1351 TaxID=2695853 RepID=UPI0034CF2512